MTLEPLEVHNVSSVFLPLRSNCGWFASGDTHARLARRLKHLLMFYDTIAFENGRYTATFGVSGSFDAMLPQNTVKDRSKIRYRADGESFAISVAPTGSEHFKPLIGGASVESYEVDFWPLAMEAGITEAPFVRWVDLELAPEGKQAANNASRHAQRDPTLVQDLPDNTFIRSSAVKALHQDAILARALDLPMSTDERIASLIVRSNASAQTTWSPDALSILQRTWLSFGLPDPAAQSWDDVLESRESAAGKDLRRVFKILAIRAIEIMSAGQSQDDWNDVVRKLFVQELVTEIMKRQLAKSEAVVNLGLNLIPYAGAALSTAKDVAEMVKEHRSWVTLLR